MPNLTSLLTTSLLIRPILAVSEVVTEVLRRDAGARGTVQLARGTGEVVW